MFACALLSSALVACGGGSGATVASASQSSQGATTTATATGDSTGAVSLAVAGGPDLPLNGTTTEVIVALAPTPTAPVPAPVTVALSRDNYTPFATWPNDSFFTRSADGTTLTGTWCISASCWGNTPGAHILRAVATYPDGTTATSSVALTVADSTSATTVAAAPVSTAVSATAPAGVASTGVTAAMWAEIATQRAAFGDPNDCKARVDAVPTTGTVLAPGGDIAAALAANNTVVLQTGTYTPTGSLLAIPTGKKLVAGPGQSPVIDLSALTNFAAVYPGDNTTIAGVEFKNAQGISIITFDTGLGRYSNGGLLYNLKVHDSGLTGTQTDGTGVSISGGGDTSQGQNWCVVAVESYNAWNLNGSSGNTSSDPTRNGGNSDGMASHFGAGQTTFIAANSHNNGDDEIDMWQGGATYHYFSSYHDGGKVPNVTNGGDGNGVKLGTGAVAHKFYKTTVTNNRTGGFNLNGNSMQPILVQSTASGNGAGDYMNGVIAP